MIRSILKYSFCKHKEIPSKDFSVWKFPMTDDFFSQNSVIKFMHIIAKTFFILAWNAYLCNPQTVVLW